MGYDFSSLDLLDALPDAIEQAAHEREAEVRSTSGRKLGLPRFSGGEAPSCQIESTPHALLFMDQGPITGAAERVDAA